MYIHNECLQVVLKEVLVQTVMLRLIGIFGYTIIFYGIGWIVYGVISLDIWATGFYPSLVYDHSQGHSVFWGVVALAIPISMGLGTTVLLNELDWPDMQRTVIVGLNLSLFIAIPAMLTVLAYANVHPEIPHALPLLLIYSLFLLTACTVGSVFVRWMNGLLQ